MKDHFDRKIKCDTKDRSEISDIAGWNCKLSWIGSIIIKQNYVKKYKITEGEMWSTLKKRENEYKAKGQWRTEKDFIRMVSTKASWKVPILRQKVTDIALHIKIDNFKASNGWFQRHLKWTM
jgi:hypothetical protein